ASLQRFYQKGNGERAARVRRRPIGGQSPGPRQPGVLARDLCAHSLTGGGAFSLSSAPVGMLGHGTGRCGMGQVRRLRGRILWIPIAAVVAVGALLAGTVLASAAAPNLPKKTAAQLLAAMSHASAPPALTAVISENADLGFPALPDIAGMPSSA